MEERIQILHRHLDPRRHQLSLCPISAEQLISHSPVYSQYKYTADIASRLLTEEQRKSYEENGFIVIKNLVRKDKLDEYRKRFQEICSGKVSTFGMTLMRDVAISKAEFVTGERAISKLQDFQWDKVLFEYCGLPEVIEHVKCFVGPNVMAMHTMLINKPPDPGTMTSRHPMHQDLYYFPFRPANRVVCAWTAMQTINRENGCLVVIPGTHKTHLLDHDYPKWEGGVNKMYHGIVDYHPKDNDRIWVEMEEGDTVFFHPLLIHGSGTNRTDGFRKSISCHYAASECEYVETKGSAQDKIAAEIEELVKKKTRSHAQVPFKDVWKYRARLVCGDQINL
jgi:phytanoyl-CoA hydroxylase